MRIATWNVNSLKARMDKVEWWLGRAEPDVLLIQETKLTDQDAPVMPFQMWGYELLHHGEGRWNGVAIASRVGIGGDVVTNFGDGPVRDSGPGSTTVFAEEDFNPFDEARMLSAVAGAIRFVSLYAPNGRVVGSPFYDGKLAWYERLARWLAEAASTSEPLVIGGDLNVAPGQSTAARTSPSPSARPSGGCSNGAWRTRIGQTDPSRGASRGGTIAPATSTRIWGCASTIFWQRRRSRSE